MPVRLQITSGTVADCICADNLIEGISAKFLLADRGYDTERVIEKATEGQMEIVIPPKRNRYQVEKTFLKLKRWRGIATRYAKNTLSYIASVQICCMFLWLNLL